MTDITLGFDGPDYALRDLGWDSIQSGFSNVGGKPGQPMRPPRSRFIWDPEHFRHGDSSARVTIQPGDYTNYSVAKEAVLALQWLEEGEGAESWYGWSWRFPNEPIGSRSWAAIMQFTTAAHLWPGYGMLSFDIATDALHLDIRTGHCPSPGATDFNPTPPNGYKARETLLGGSGPRPLTREVWHDFIFHVVWMSREPGLMRLEHREENGKWGVLYDNRITPAASPALIQRAPHPTLMWNDKYGAPSSTRDLGLIAQCGYYRANEATTRYYWFDGFRRRQSLAAVVVGFPADIPPPALEPELRLVAESATTITLAWDPPPGVAGYQFLSDGNVVSTTNDPRRTSVRFGKGKTEYQVVPVFHVLGQPFTYRRDAP